MTPPQPASWGLWGGHRAALLVGRQRAVRDPRAAAGQRTGLGEHNRLGIVLADPAHPFDPLEHGHRAPQLGAVVRGGFGSLHGSRSPVMNKPPSLRHDFPSATQAA